MNQKFPHSSIKVTQILSKDWARAALAYGSAARSARPIMVAHLFDMSSFFGAMDNPSFTRLDASPSREPH
jgi:hypothetical protein